MGMSNGFREEDCCDFPDCAYDCDLTPGAKCAHCVDEVLKAYCVNHQTILKAAGIKLMTLEEARKGTRTAIRNRNEMETSQRAAARARELRAKGYIELLQRKQS